jgi:peptidoglycan-associated lipoprotein
VRIRVEGHADERGETEYNLALGDKRARSVKKYLEDLGVTSDRMEVVSYGEEKPAVVGSNEEAWSKNRRAEFVIVAN